MQQGRMLGGILLVAGTAVGAGMLALPVSTGLAGFYPSLFIFVLCWLFMTFSALLTLEVSLWMGKKTDLVTMAERTLGKTGKFFAIVIYLLLLYALIAAYVSGSAQIFSEAFHSFFGIPIPKWLAPIPILLIFGPFVYGGIKMVDYANRFLALALIAAYFFLVAALPSHIEPVLFEHQDWNYLLVAISIVITAFGFHVVIPSLSPYLDYDRKKLRTVIIVGSCIPLVIYIIWEFLVLGIVPLEGENGLIQAWAHDLPATESLKSILQKPSISLGTRCFAFFSILTSFLGVSLSLSNFIADGLRIEKTTSGRVLIAMLTFIPPLIFIMSGTRSFYIALEYAGIFVAILLGLYPVLMVWSGRYKKGISSPSSYKVIGGRVALVIAALFFFSIVMLEAAHKMNWLEFTLQEYINP